jgi:CubicO group peptidase (beta-lactamase class C family)
MNLGFDAWKGLKGRNMNLSASYRWSNLVLSLIGLFPASLSHAEEPSRIVSVLQPFVDRHELAGAVTLVASKDNVLSLEAVGYADIAGKKRLQTDALFWIASMSKPIAATALMMLVDEGKVRLDDSVDKYLPQFMPRIIRVTPDGAHVRLESPQHAITVRNLLSHTSGIPFSSSLEMPTLDVFPLAVRVQSYAFEPLIFEPGSDYSYSNAGINTAARIVEVVSGMPYQAFLQKRLFDPLRMIDTTFWPTDAQVERLAKSYKTSALGTGLEETPITQLLYPLTDRTHRYPMPAGGLFSTAVDLGRYCQMILNGGVVSGRRYLSTAAIQEMSRNQLSNEVLQKEFSHRSDPADSTGYGLGWQTYPSGAFGHGGAYATNLRIDPQHGLATVWLVQHAGFPGDGSKSEAAFEKVVMERYSPR